MTFHAWTDDVDMALRIETSPAGRILLRSWRGATQVPDGGTAVLLPTQRARIVWADVAFALGEGCYAQVPGGTCIQSGAGLMIYTPDYVGLPQAGGPVEPVGRLHYIDGCSDSLLVCPAQIGEPCLNLLHLPAGIHQTAHTHPSDRIGIILRGAGRCRTLEGETPLRPGMFWYIPPGYVHSFHTETEALDVLAWHPDSDFGPSHDWHPMLNRTIVDGVSAADPRHQAIRTTGV